MFGNHGLCGLPEEGAHEKSPKCLGGNLGDFGGILQRSPVVAERLQARFADKNDNAGLSQALFDFAAQNGWEPYDCLALCICLFNEQEQERIKREFELA